MQPIVDFLSPADRSEYRYLTFGFGDQFAYLNLLTKATTIDGSYHTARTLPELRESGIGQIDTAYWALMGIPAIEPILKKSGDYGVRWGFVNPDVIEAIPLRWHKVHRSPFVPLLERLGWSRMKVLSNGIMVYENPTAIKPELPAAPKSDPFTSFSWGTLPVLSLVTTLSLGALRVYPVAAERVIRLLHATTIGLLPIGLCFWIYQTIAEFAHPRVYFTYTHALFFIADVLVLLAVILWLSVKISQLPLAKDREASPWSQLILHPLSFAPCSIIHFRLSSLRPASLRACILRSDPSSFILALSLLCLLSSFSLLWSRDWHVSLYMSLHLWLVFLLILSLRDWHQAWKFAAFGLCTALGIETITGFIGFAAQSTSFLRSLNLEWPGLLDPSIRSASVVQLVDGFRILRAYGTLPHPNILGGFALLSLLGPASLFITNDKPSYPALVLFTFGIILIVLTFSRSAWLGMLIFMGVLALKARSFDRKRLFLFLAVGVLTILLALYPLRELVFTRVAAAPVATEQLSIFGREWLNQQAIGIFQDRPLTGVGAGAFIIELASSAVEGAPIEPVHNVLLLAGSELGIFGGLLSIGLFVAMAVTIVKSRSPRAILAGATVAALGVTALFDHYLWSLAPGRIMLGLALGLWSRQVDHQA
jgi:O-antigen ligase